MGDMLSFPMTPYMAFRLICNIYMSVLCFCSDSVHRQGAADMVLFLCLSYLLCCLPVARRPQITILSAEPLTSTSWFPGPPGGVVGDFPPPPPPAAQIWGPTIPAALQVILILN